MISTTVLAIASAMIQAKDPVVEARLMRQPDIHGSTIVFLYAGDLWASSIEPGSVAKKIASSVGVYSDPAFSPVARPHISPDGKWVAFSGNYDGVPNIYVVPIEGGEPRRLTYNQIAQQVFDWTPDGRVAYLTTEGMPQFVRQQHMKIVDVNGGIPQDTPVKEVAAGSFMGSSDKIVYTRGNSFNFNWRRYRGGTQGRISFYDMAKNEYSELPAKREQSHFPMPIGDSIYYISDRGDGILNLYKNAKGRDTKLTQSKDGDIKWPASDGKTIVFERDGLMYHFDPATKVEKRLSIQVPSEHLGARPAQKNLVPYLSGLAISPSGARVAIDARGEVFSVPSKSGETRNMTQSSGVREKEVAWSPDGKWITYMSDKDGENHLYSQPQAGGEEKQLTKNLPFLLKGYEWFPTSKKVILYATDMSFHVLDLGTKEIKKVGDYSYGVVFSIQNDLSISQDGKWIAYTKGRANGWKQIVAYEVETGKTTQITEGYYNDGEIAFDHNGKYLYFSSSREFNPTHGSIEMSLKVEETDRLYAVALQKGMPNPFLEGNDEEPDPDAKPPLPAPKPESDVRIDFDGIESRVMVLPMPIGSYVDLNGATGSFFFVDAANGTLMNYRMGAKAPTPMYQGYFGGVFNPTRTKLATIQPGNQIQVLDVAPGMSAASPGRVNLSNVEAVIDPKQEWAQIIKDAWRHQRDTFYEPKMRGVDWNAMGQKYTEMVKHANHRTDVSFILGLMIAEVGTGHSYVTAPGDIGALPFAPSNIGTLCADYEVVNGGVRFKKILRGFNDREASQTPLGQPGVEVQEGEYLVAIDNKPVDATVNPAALLIGKAGKFVTLMVNSKPGMSGARKVRVKAIASERSARYEEFIENNRKMVSKLSGGRIGYMHIRDTSFPGASDFVRGYYSQSDKDAMIVDERWNGGGLIQPWFVETLMRTKKAMIQTRNDTHIPEAQTIEGPMAMLINGYAGSGGDFFPYLFRQAKRGQIIGTRTWGGLVGILGSYNLVDGGGFTSPCISLYNPDTGEMIAENAGIDPDIEVDDRPDLVAKGQDPQLEAAVKHLMEQLAKAPSKKTLKGVPTPNKGSKIGNK